METSDRTDSESDFSSFSQQHFCQINQSSLLMEELVSMGIQYVTEEVEGQPGCSSVPLPPPAGDTGVSQYGASDLTAPAVGSHWSHGSHI